MELIFRGLGKGKGEIIYLNIDRKKKMVIIKTSKTNYQPRQIPFYQLFVGDTRFQKRQESITKGFDDKKFKDIVIKTQRAAGYGLIKNVKNS